MKSNALVRIVMLEHQQPLSGPNPKIQLFADFPFSSLLGRFPTFHLAARKLPQAVKIAANAPGEQNPAIQYDDRRGNIDACP